MKKMLSLVMTLVMVVSICCSCAASSNTDTTPEKDSTTESTKETTTNDTSTADTSEVVRQDSSTPAETETADTSETTENTSDSSLAKLEAVDESEAVAIGLSEQQISEAFAFVAYNISKNSNSEKFLDLNYSDKDWYDAICYLDILKTLGAMNSIKQISAQKLIDENQAILPHVSNEDLQLIIENLFAYCYAIKHFDFSELLFDENNTLQDTISNNLTFSEEQLKLGEEVAQEISELETEN